MYVSRGDAYVGLGKYEQAIADYVRALKLAQRNASEIMGKDYASRTRTFDLAPIYDKLAAAYAALAAKSRELK
jgi:tetratricopeptide (TPR) repeat protein